MTGKYEFGPYIGRVENRDEGTVLVELFGDATTIHLSDNDEFVTVMMTHDPFSKRSDG